jgi:hypothetical protein
VTAASAIETEPRILVDLCDPWSGTLLCAELRERGYLAGRVERLAAAILVPSLEQVGLVRTVVGDGEALGALDTSTLQWLRRIGNGPAVAILVAAGAPTPEGPWDRVLRRPLTIGAVADTVEELVRAAPPARDWRFPGIDVRLDAPWPSVRCLHCNRSRHCEPPRNDVERELVRVAFVKFALEHEQPRGHGTGRFTGSASARTGSR